MAHDNEPWSLPPGAMLNTSPKSTSLEESMALSLAHIAASNTRIADALEGLLVLLESTPTEETGE